MEKKKNHRPSLPDGLRYWCQLLAVEIITQICDSIVQLFSRIADVMETATSALVRRNGAIFIERFEKFDSEWRELDDTDTYALVWVFNGIREFLRNTKAKLFVLIIFLRDACNDLADMVAS